ncbi:MAG: AAA family ATPase [Thermoguttaceae bacterium]|nr:AAA family ATPase [Thermoguttaceae bacterium]MBR6435262.1 AAA family ATPase [Thermoguttaceae bacterium]
MIFDYTRYQTTKGKEPSAQEVEDFKVKFIAFWNDKLNWDFTFLDTFQYKALLKILASCNLALTNPEYKTDEGLFLTGCPGCGKTTLALAISNVCQINYLTANEIEDAVIKDNEISVSKFYFGNGLIIDDLGSEANKKVYGNDPPLKNFLYRLYDEWKVKRIPLIVCSNLTLNRSAHWIASTYGLRVSSRFNEMTRQFVIGNGVDRRSNQTDTEFAQSGSFNSGNSASLFDSAVDSFSSEKRND